MDLNAIPAPKRGWGNIAVASWCHFVGDFYCNLLPVLLPILALKFGLSYSQCGLLYMIFQVSASFLQAPIGIAADKHNLGILLPVSIITGGVLASAVGGRLEDKSIRNRREIINFCSASLGSHGVKKYFFNPQFHVI